jgi:nicotinamide-nucleotide amidase
VNEMIEQSVIRLSQALIARKSLLATAESCTGGLVAGSATAIAGSSSWFDQGWITYSNAAKQAQLGVTTETLKAYGAVSEQTAGEMATGVLTKAPKASLAIAITGIAGPGGGSPGKPVGFVCFGFGLRKTDGALSIRTVSKVFDGDRSAVREASVKFALDTAYDCFSEATQQHPG